MNKIKTYLNPLSIISFFVSLVFWIYLANINCGSYGCTNGQLEKPARILFIILLVSAISSLISVFNNKGKQQFLAILLTLISIVLTLAVYGLYLSRGWFEVSY